MTSRRDFYALPARLVPAVLLGIVVVVHLPGLANRVFNNDEAYVATVADVIAHGGRLYVDAVDRKPPAHVPAEMRARRARDETHSPPNAVLLRQSPADDVERSNAGRNHFKDCRRIGVEVAVDEAHLGPDITPRIPRQAGGRSGAIVPAQPRESDWPRIAPH